MALKNLTKNKTIRGGLAGAASQAASQLGPLGPGAATAAVGMLTKDDWAQEMGGFQLGAAFAQGSGVGALAGDAAHGGLI